MPLAGELDEIDIAGLQAGLLARRFSAREVVAAYLERIERADKSGPALNAITAVSNTVLGEAKDLDARLERTGELRGPLHGVPVIVKDQIETAGLRTTYGSARAAANIPGRDATVVALLKDAGALILAKSTLPDFATSWFSTSSVSGLTRNPYALDRDPGGSSSGTAAAVAANLGLVGIGEDTGGSIRLPASFTSLVGIRPTVGLVSTAGVSSFLVGTDTVGPMTRTVADAARLLDVLSRADRADPLTALADGHRRSLTRSYLDAAQHPGAGPLRLGLVTSLLPAGTGDAPLIRATLAGAADRLRAGGVSLTELDLPQAAEWVSGGGPPLPVDDLNAFIASRPGIAAGSIEEIYQAGDYHERLTILAEAARAAASPRSPGDQIAGERARQSLRRDVAAAIAGQQLDALIYPDVQALPPLHSAITSGAVDAVGFPTNTVLASALGFPAISVPAGFTTTGLPVGLELLGLPFGEIGLVAAASRIETLVAGRRPPPL